MRNARIQQGAISIEWTLEDYLYSLKARLGPIKRLGGDVLTMMISLFRALWPGVPEPTTIRGLAEKMAEAQDRLIEWRESAARVGADEALTYVLSWYETIDLSKLRGTRQGSKWIEDAKCVEAQKRVAQAMIEYADIHEFCVDPNAPAEEAECEAMPAQGEDDEWGLSSGDEAAGAESEDSEHESEGEDGDDDDGEDEDQADADDEDNSEAVDEDIIIDTDPRPAPSSDGTGSRSAEPQTTPPSDAPAGSAGTNPVPSSDAPSGPDAAA